MDWSSSSPANSSTPNNAFANLSLRPTPGSSRSASPATSLKPGQNDSFSNLVAFGRDKQSSSTLSLQEQQRALEEKRRKDEEAKRKQMDALFGGMSETTNGDTNVNFWDQLGNGGRSTAPPAPAPAAPADDEDDILAAFNSAAPVDKSSHFPAPSTSSPFDTASPLDDLDGFSRNAAPKVQQPIDPFDEMMRPQSHFTPPAAQQTAQDDDDILGDLGKPISELPPRPERVASPPIEEKQDATAPVAGSDPRDPAIAEILEMGFSAAQAKKALSETDTGLDVEAAVTWLLEEAHRKSRPAGTPSSNSRSGSQQGRSSRNQERSATRPRREDTESPAWARNGKQEGEKDIGAYAASVSGSLFKSANNLWNTSKKKVEKTIAEFNADLADGGGDPNVPKWMREQQIRDQLAARGAQVRQHRREEKPQAPDTRKPDAKAPSQENITDEAMMLEMGTGPPPKQRRQREERATPSPSFSRDSSSSRPSEKDLMRQRAMEAAIREKEQAMRERAAAARSASAIPDSASRRAKLATDDEPVAYVSRNRRRPPPSSSTSSKPSTPAPPEGDLLFGGGNTSKSAPPSRNPFERDVAEQQQAQRQPIPKAASTRMATPPVPRAPAPQRPNIPISPSALQSSNSARQAGNEAFKRGDYAAAQTFYTNSLNPIPEQHLLRIILLTNRSLCTVKLGDPKAAIVDFDAILSLIGESRGDGETIPLDGTQKDMKDYWTKATTRKAEALEQLEKWADAKSMWETAINAGAGGSNAIVGRDRCEKALAPKPAVKPKPAPRRPPPARTTSQKDAAAVTALRKANKDAEKADAEKHALYDVVEERINKWKAGKEGNLRALLAGLDTVLWEGAGWKKVGMGELLVPQKCKIVYMKGIAKVHPDKIPATATTEQRMISAAVFSLLNEAWDGFKKENGL